MTRVLLVDGNWYLHRAYSVATLRRNYRSFKRTIPAQFLGMVCKDFLETHSSYLGVFFDSPHSFRFDIYPEYKANRKRESLYSILSSMPHVKIEDLPEEFSQLSVNSYLKKAKQVCAYAGLPVFQIKGFESDDPLATAAVHLCDEHEVYVSTHDKDLLAVVRQNVFQYWPAQGKGQESKVLGEAEVVKYKGVEPRQIRDLLCMLGDKADNIPGTPDVGEKRAVALLQEYGSIAKALRHRKDKTVQKLLASSNQLLLARKLVQLNLNCWEPKLEDFLLRDADEEALVNAIGKVPQSLTELQGNRILKSHKGLFK